MRNLNHTERVLLQLRRQRRNEYWKEIVPYFRYVAQSGLLTFIILGAIIFSAYYVSLLQNIPDQFPIRYIAWVVFALPIIYSSFRTYIKPADFVYLLPLETKTGYYFRGSWIGAIIIQSMLISVVLAVIWPLYVRADPTPKWFIVLWAAWLGLKLVNSIGSWQERRMSSLRARLLFRVLRWAMTIGLIAVWLWYPTWEAFVFSCIAILAYMIVMHMPRKFAVPWEYLIFLEEQQKYRNLLCLNWFVDVPGLPQRVHWRPWLDWVGNRIKFHPSSAYLYLYTRTFVRSELLGIVLRFMLVGLLMLWWRQQSVWVGLLYAFFLLVTGFQLTAVRQFHKYTMWRSVYPLPDRLRKEAVLRIVYRTHLIAAIVLWVPLLFGPGSILLRGIYLLGGTALVILFQIMWSRQPWMREQ